MDGRDKPGHDEKSELDLRLVAGLDALGDPLLHPPRDDRAVVADIHEVRALARQCVVDAIIDQTAARPPGDDAPVRAKVVTTATVVLWVGVIYFGRMMPFIGNSF